MPNHDKVISSVCLYIHKLQLPRKGQSEPPPEGGGGLVYIYSAAEEEEEH